MLLPAKVCKLVYPLLDSKDDHPLFDSNEIFISSGIKKGVSSSPM